MAYIFKKCKKNKKKQTKKQKTKETKTKTKKKEDFSKNMPPCHFLNSNSNREFIKNTKKSIMFLRTSFIELLISYY